MSLIGLSLAQELLIQPETLGEIEHLEAHAIDVTVCSASPCGRCTRVMTTSMIEPIVVRLDWSTMLVTHKKGTTTSCDNFQ